MTGFGRAKKSFEKQVITIEIKSLNSKGLDIRTRLAAQYQSKEIDLRKKIQQAAIRGKVDINLSVESIGDSDYKIDQHAFQNYYNQLNELTGTYGMPKGDILYTVTRLPGVIVQNTDEVDESLWLEVLETFDQAIENFNNFRAQEGAAMLKDIQLRITNVEKLLEQVEPFEAARLEKIRARLLANFEKAQLNGKIDDNRFEQEMTYFLDKFDLTEEKIRLSQHCTYFTEVVSSSKASKGKKLGFILQEMGREINTLGSKANSADLQRVVVQMKDEADKVKEQLANIL
ncbi:MAG: YicC family protein [Aureispira sp.]|nr:YicC family protein [Aureispira sp.]